MGKLVRKQFQLTAEEGQLLEEFAALNQVGKSAVGREWIEAFVLHGSDAKPTEYVRLQVMIDEDVLTEALDRCEREGIGLEDVIKHEIAEIRKLT